MTQKDNKNDCFWLSLIKKKKKKKKKKRKSTLAKPDLFTTGF